jgi:hypothetical protein
MVVRFGATALSYIGTAKSAIWPTGAAGCGFGVAVWVWACIFKGCKRDRSGLEFRLAGWKTVSFICPARL